MTPPFRLEPLHDRHDRAGFTCGEEALDRYLRTQVSQDIRRRITSCFVAVPTGVNQIAGYYTIAAAGIPTPQLPPDLIKRLPRYPSIPAVRIGRLAVAIQFRGRGLGSALLADAVARALEAPPAVYAMLVDAKNDESAAFSRRFGFRPFASQPRTLFLPTATAEKILL